MSRIITLDEFFGDEKKNANSEGNVAHELRFTGNWFIDAGILGFVNLMKEVYGWDLEELQRRIKENPELVYYGYFPFAYFYKWLKDRNEEVSESVIKQLIDEVERFNVESNYRLFEFVWSKFICKLFKNRWIKNIMSKIKSDKLILKTDDKLRNKILQILDDGIDNNGLKQFKEFLKDLEGIKTFNDEVEKYIRGKLELIWDNILIILKNLEKLNLESKDFNKILAFCRIPIDSGFYKNFLFFNNSYDYLKQFKSFYYAIAFDIDRIKDKKMRVSLSRIDKMVNKFLPSKNEFSNIYYAELSSKIFKQEIPYLFVYLLCFVYAFTRFRGIGFVLFYSNDLYLTYEINKRLKVYQEKVQDQSSLFKITWREIIDVLVEYKSYWSLEDMYIIKYSRLDNQTQEGVEYIGISKLQASILIEDPIREALNNNIPINKDARIWVLEEFIKNKPLYDVVLKHVSYCLREKNGRDIQRKTSLYALAVDAKIKENNDIDLFSDRFLEGFRSLVSEIKECYSRIDLNATNISRLFDNEEERRQIGYSLLSALKKKNRIAFANILLKKFLEKAGNEEVSRLNRFVFEDIISNDTSWENYALALVIGILSFGGGSVGEEPKE